MVRRTGSYESIIRGVSEQVPQDRRIGQHTEQINFISDPVRGLARRRGSKRIAEVYSRPYTEGSWASLLADTAPHKTYSFQNQGSDYDIMYRTRASGPGQVANDFAFCFNKDSGTWVPVVLQSGSPFLDSIMQGGVSAITAVGRYLFIAGNSAVSAFTGTDDLSASVAQMVAWVRGGGYSRTYTVKLLRSSGASSTHTYKTPSSSYPGTLDTSDIPITIPDPANPTGPEIPNEQYQKLVNDRVNAYNTEVTKWIGTAAAAIVPAAIAESLMQVIRTDTGWTSVETGRLDSTILFNTVGLADPVVELSCTDGGDGTLFRGVGSEISSIDMVSAIHYAGKVVKVRPKKKDGTDVFYLKAYPKAGVGGVGEVTWRESAGFTTTPTDFCAMATVSAGTLYIAANAAGLTAMIGGTHPAPVPSGVGDRVSNPPPSFLGKRIDYLGMFQDRLIIGAGAVVFFSRTGDYQNFFRQSVLSLDDSDPVEMFALGAEDDVIKAGTTYDRNLLLFGKRKQYVVSGRQPLTPKNSSIVVQSSHEDAVDSTPLNSGNFVFYNKFRGGVVSTHQIQIGQLADTPESYEVSKQLDRYIQGRPVSLVAITAPNVLFLRTETQRDRLYVYTYLDTAAGGERLFDSWSSWVTPAGCGAMIGVSRHDGDILGYYIRRVGNDIRLVADRFVLDTGIADAPYLDSYREYENSLPFYGEVGVSVAYGSVRPEFLLGAPWSKRQDLIAEYGVGELYTGLDYNATVTPTNPYVLDQNGKAIISGRLTVSRFSVSVADTSGMLGTVSTRFGDKVAVDWSGRIVGARTNLVGVVPVTTTAISLVVGREVRDFSYTLSSRSWLPITITAIEWAAQFFNNTRRG